MGIELNALAFVPLAMGNSVFGLEGVVKYFLIQSISSVVFFFFFLVSVWVPAAGGIGLIWALRLKVGVAPLHQ